MDRLFVYRVLQAYQSLDRIPNEDDIVPSLEVACNEITQLIPDGQSTGRWLIFRKECELSGQARHFDTRFAVRGIGCTH